MVYLGGDTRKQESETGKEEKLRPGWAAEVAAVSGGLVSTGISKEAQRKLFRIVHLKKMESFAHLLLTWTS